MVLRPKAGGLAFSQNEAASANIFGNKSNKCASFLRSVACVSAYESMKRWVQKDGWKMLLRISVTQMLE